MDSKIIFIIGPGGVGKSTCGKIAAEKMGFDFVDLDSEFMERVGHIGNFIREKGYAEYCKANSALFYDLVDRIGKDSIFVLSSGFLTYEIDDLKNKHIADIKSRGRSILLLPSEDLEEGLGIVVERQLKRGFGLVREKEEKTFRERFFEYEKLGDHRIFSSEVPDKIADVIIDVVKSY